MTDANRRSNLADELARADAAFAAADALVQLGLYADAISRAYYAAFHMLRALAFARGIEARTHAGVIHIFNSEFVRSGVFPSSNNRLLSGLQRARELADYDAAIVFGEEDARAEVANARTFAAAARQWLATEGWIGA